MEVRQEQNSRVADAYKKQSGHGRRKLTRWMGQLMQGHVYGKEWADSKKIQIRVPGPGQAWTLKGEGR